MEGNDSPNIRPDDTMVHVPREPTLNEDFQQQLERVQGVLNEVNRKVVAFVKERPGVCIAGAVAVGYLIGRAAARRWLR